MHGAGCEKLYEKTREKLHEKACEKLHEKACESLHEKTCEKLRDNYMAPCKKTALKHVCIGMCYQGHVLDTQRVHHAARPSLHSVQEATLMGATGTWHVHCNGWL